jgi:tetratricopeptide (TPR) repeat protein
MSRGTIRAISAGIFGLLALLLPTTGGLADAVTGAATSPTLFALDGVRPVAVAAEDDIRQSVGVLFIDGGEPAQYDRNNPAYATAFLVSSCHVIARQRSLLPLADMTKNEQGLGTLEGLRFGLHPRSGATGARLSQSDFRRSWPAIVIPEISGGMQRMDMKYGPWQDWLAFRLSDCTPDSMPPGANGTLLPMTSAELSAVSNNVKVRHVGVLDANGLEPVAVDCWLLGSIDRPTWKANCTSWLGMAGGPVQIFDEQRKRWVTVGMMAQPLLKDSIGSVDNDLSPDAWAVQPVDISDPFLFERMPEAIPISTIWPMIAEEIADDRPYLADGADEDAEEPEFDLEATVNRLEDRKWKGERSALHAASVAIGLHSLCECQDAMIRSLLWALEQDPNLASAALKVAPLLEVDNAYRATNADLQRVARALDTAVGAAPDSLPLLRARMVAARRQARFDAVLADADRYVAAGGGGGDDVNWIHARRGYANFALGKLDEAAIDYQTAIRANPRDADSERELAKIMLQQGHIDQAKPHAQAAVRLDPHDPSNHVVRGLVALYGGDVDRAVEEMESAREQSSRMPYYALWMAVVSAYQKSLSADAPAMPLLAKSDVDPTYPNWWPYPAAAVFMGERDVQSLQSIDLTNFLPDDHRACEVGRAVFTAAYQVALGQPTDLDALNKVLDEHPDLAMSLLIPVINNWGKPLTPSQ